MIHYMLAHPLRRGLNIDNRRYTEIRWSVTQKKPFLRQIYEEWCSAISAVLMLPQEPVPEFGSGGGFKAAS
jgi:hypothetical protein